ncbi:MAG: hypothetical protein HQK72_02115 [Desulfamplus sp.]|nr:hypothetical protein [Desulfamplus sp.]
MDTLKEIDSLIDSLSVEVQNKIKLGVSQHISRAEYHFRQAKTKNDDQYYTDAIYRTNQAYEGILREAYELLAKKTSEKMKTFEIEDYFEKENVFNYRVKKAFTNYRQEWRNTATHNHNLFFKKDEAFLAIVNVSAFIYILLNQIVEKVAYSATKENIKNKNLSVTIPKDIKQNTIESIKFAFLNYHKYVITSKIENMNEAQLLGNLTAYFEEILIGFKIFAEYEIGDTKYHCDLLVSRDDEKPVIIEIKVRFDRNNYENAIRQVLSYLNQTKMDVAFIYFASENKTIEYVYEEKILNDKKIYVFMPEKKYLTTNST